MSVALGESMPALSECLDGARESLRGLDDDGITQALRDIETHLRKTHAVMLELVAEAESRRIAAHAGFGSTARLLAGMLQLSTGEARTRVEHASMVGTRRALTGEVLAPQLPATAAALAAGQIGVGQLRVITQAMAALPAAVPQPARDRAEADLAGYARDFDPRRLRVIAERITGTIDPDGPEPTDNAVPTDPTRGELWLRTRRDGRLTLEGWLNPEHGSLVRALIEQLATPRPGPDGAPDTRSVPARQADALIELCDRARAAGEFPATGGEPPHVTVTIDWDALRTGVRLRLVTSLAGGATVALVLDIYARVSRLGDDRQRSTAGQVEDCQARIEERGAQVGEVHIDSGRSAWNPRVRRPDWERLMARLEAGATGGVIVFDMARFSRRPIEGERLILAAERGLVVLDSEGEYDLTTANGRKTFRDQLNAAAYESDRLSTRVKRGKRVKATRGEPNHTWRPFGFERDGVTVREPEAVVLREMAARVLTGEKFDHIARDLNQRGVTTSTDGMWSRESVKQLLSRQRNVGQVVHNGVVVGHLPGEPILDNETWERLTTLFASRRRGRPASEMYLCSGIVCCGKCGNRLTGRPKQPYPNGEIRREYFCHPRTVGGGCGGTAIGQRELDRHVGALVVRILSDPRHAEALEAAAKATEDKRRPVLAELSECEHLADELSGRLGRREIPIQRYDVAIAPLDKRIAELRAELAELDSKAPAAVTDPAIVAASREEWTARWNAATVAERRNLIRQALTNRRIVIAPFVPSSGRRKFDPKRIVIEEEHHAHSRLPGLPS